MTSQELFDTVVKHLRKQRTTSFDVDINGNGGRCVYRGPGGLKCAVGALIPNREYLPEMEGKSVYSLVERRFSYYCPSLAVKLNTSKKMSLAAALQRVHDDLTGMDWRSEELMILWEKDFQSVARDFKLRYTPPRKTKGKK